MSKFSIISLIDKFLTFTSVGGSFFSTVAPSTITPFGPGLRLLDPSYDNSGALPISVYLQKYPSVQLFASGEPER